MIFLYRFVFCGLLRNTFFLARIAYHGFGDDAGPADTVLLLQTISDRDSQRSQAIVLGDAHCSQHCRQLDCIRVACCPCGDTHAVLNSSDDKLGWNVNERYRQCVWQALWVLLVVSEVLDKLVVTQQARCEPVHHVLQTSQFAVYRLYQLCVSYHSVVYFSRRDLRCEPQSLAVQNVLRPGTHTSLLSGTVDELRQLDPGALVQNANSLRSVQLMSGYAGTVALVCVNGYFSGSLGAIGMIHRKYPRILTRVVSVDDGLDGLCLVHGPNFVVREHHAHQTCVGCEHFFELF